MFEPSPVHILVLLAVILLIYGPRRLPEVGRGLGRSIREFRGAITHSADDREDPAPVPPAVSPDDAVSERSETTTGP